MRNALAMGVRNGDLLGTFILLYGNHTHFHRQTRKTSKYMVRMARSDRVIVITLIILSALTLIKDLRVWRRYSTVGFW